MNTRTPVAALTLALITTPAAAAGNFYVAATGGYTRADINQAEIDSEITGAGLSLLSSSLDKKDAGYKLQAGYQFNPYFAVEGGWVDLGQYRYTASVTGGNAVMDAKARGWNLGVVGTLPLPNNFGLMARLGMIEAKVETELHATGTGGSVHDTATSKKWKNHWGLGGLYGVTPNLGIRLEYEEFQKLGDADTTGETDITMWSLGLSYRF
jgi:OOP family OmpA-OmpF porin